MYPPKCISKSVLKIYPTEFISHHKISGSEIEISFCKHISEHFLLGCFFIFVTFEILDRIASYYFPYKFTRFSSVCPNTKSSVRVSNNFACISINLNNVNRQNQIVKPFWCTNRSKTNGSYFVLYICQATIALRST